MPGTTLYLESRLFEDLKTLAARRGLRVSQLASVLLREAVRSADERPARPLEWETIPEGDFVPGFDPADRALLHVLDDPAMTAPTQTVSPSG